MLEANVGRESNGHLHDRDDDLLLAIEDQLQLPAGAALEDVLPPDQQVRRVGDRHRGLEIPLAAVLSISQVGVGGGDHGNKQRKRYNVAGYYEEETFRPHPFQQVMVCWSGDYWPSKVLGDAFPAH